MNENLTELVVVIDKSGSMDSVTNDAIGGFNAFLKSQKEAPGEAKMTVVLFDTTYSFYAANVDVKSVNPLDNNSYKPQGGTALYDAVGTAIDEIGKKLADMEEKDRPSKVVFAILTDGEENSSKKYNRQKVFNQIATQRDTYKWEFLFLAAGKEAFTAGESLGMAKTKMAMFKNDAKGNTASYDALAAYTTAYRGTKGDFETMELSRSINLQSVVNESLAKLEAVKPPEKAPVLPGVETEKKT